MKAGEWIKEFRESKGMTQKGLAYHLRYKGTFPLREVESGIKPGYGVLSRIIKQFEIRPDDDMIKQCLDDIGTMHRAYPKRIKRVFERAEKFPIWMPNGREEKPMSKPETTRGKTMLKLAEKPEPTQEQKDKGEVTTLLRRLKNLRHEITQAYWQPGLKRDRPEPKSRFERAVDYFFRAHESDINMRARDHVLADLYQEFQETICLLTDKRLNGLLDELERIKTHYKSILEDLDTMQKKVATCQDEINMLTYYIGNAFAYLKLGGEVLDENGSCKTDPEPV